jgi:hypothetical protein
MGTQANVKIVDPLTGEDIEPIIANSDDGGILVLTIAGNVAIGTDQACRSVLLHTDAADVTMKIDGDETAADANDFLLLAATLFPIPVSNLKFLRFYGATNDAKVYILYRN